MKAIANQTTRLFKGSVIVFVLTIIVTLYWYLPLLISVYRFPVIGAIYEILWVFMILGLFALPVISFIFWAKIMAVSLALSAVLLHMVYTLGKSLLI